MRNKATCHPGLPLHALGMCKKCYLSDYWAKNGERLYRQKAEYRQSNKSRISESQRKWYQSNKELKQGKYYEENKAKIIARVSEYAKNHPKAMFWRKQSRRARTFNVSIEEIHRLYDSSCELCGKRPVVLDHDHQTGRLRGALCVSCNGAIGALGDTKQGIMKALDYLTKNETSEINIL